MQDLFFRVDCFRTSKSSRTTSEILIGSGKWVCIHDVMLPLQEEVIMTFLGRVLESKGAHGRQNTTHVQASLSPSQEHL